MNQHATIVDNLEVVATLVPTQTSEQRLGLAFWMYEVPKQCDKVEAGFQADPVHDLRTSLRRCRSIADGMRVFDGAPAWKKMKRAGRDLFRSLGAVRDAHVLEEWLKELAPKEDVVAKRISEQLESEEEDLKKVAAGELEKFDRKQWKVWADELPDRALHIPIDSPVLAHLALERWHQAYDLHRIAMRNKSSVGLHQLRIGLKRFRYILENFLPALYQGWEDDLKKLQDTLGDVHDLDVLWQRAVQIKAFPDSETRLKWRTRIQQERQKRLKVYRDKMVGRESLWQQWRAALPREEDLRQLSLERFRIRAALTDPEFRHTEHATNLALRLFDGISTKGILPPSKREDCRDLLEAAVFLHDLGLAKANKGHHKISARQIRKIDPPLGWSPAEMRLMALIARYHRGALPRESQARFGLLSPGRQRLVQFLAGILRLACACDREHDGRIRYLQVSDQGPVLTIQANGYSESSALAEHLAAARHLLEIAYQRPIIFKPEEAQQTIHAA